MEKLHVERVNIGEVHSDILGSVWQEKMALCEWVSTVAFLKA
jgi:hypothetical protein